MSGLGQGQLRSHAARPIAEDPHADPFAPTWAFSPTKPNTEAISKQLLRI